MASYRQDRLTEDIKRELTDVMRSLKDPRIKGLLSIVGIDLSRDLSWCKVYISSMDGFEAAKSSIIGLNSAAGFVRHEIGNRIDMRKTPQFNFIADDSIEHSAMINEKLKNLL
ncbi:MAG: 30S ribosome-binding factor RbfA [Oscillospiraceae bacterium]